MARKAALVLCPGLLNDAALWAAQVADLADVAEPRVADFTTQTSIRAMAESVLLAAPPRFALAGLSMGGYVAQEIMRLARDRVTRLALLDSSARPEMPEQTERRQALIALARQGKFNGVSTRLLPLLIDRDRLNDQALTTAVTAMAERVGRDAFIRQQQAIMGRADGRPDLTAIECPTLVLCGRDDQLTPLALHEEMAAAIANADLVVLARCGHLAPMERPAAVSAALRAWLAEDN